MKKKKSFESDSSGDKLTSSDSEKYQPKLSNRIVTTSHNNTGIQEKHVNEQKTIKSQTEKSNSVLFISDNGSESELCSIQLLTSQAKVGNSDSDCDSETQS